MNSILKFINKNGFFYSVNFLLGLVIVLFLFVFSRTDGFIWLNQYHTYFLNHFFESITNLGDGLFIILTAVVLFFTKKRHKRLAYLIIFSYISSGLFVQILKNLIDAPRPCLYFEMHHFNYYLNVFATSRTGFSSFPSGHTASFFAFATVISCYFKKRYVCLSMLAMSTLVGFSRVYLAHHFPIDVFAGAIIGVVFGTLTYVWFVKFKINKFIRKRLRKLKKSNKNAIPTLSINQ